MSGLAQRVRGHAAADRAAKVTEHFPKEKRPKPERFHGRHVLNRYEDGMEKCIGCELCAGVCPAKCIYVRGADNPPDAPVSPGERYGFVYEINYLRCIHCDLCVEACPTEAITETKLFEFSFTNREDAIYTKAGAARRRRRPRPSSAVGAVARRRGRRHERVDARDGAVRAGGLRRPRRLVAASSGSACARPKSGSPTPLPDGELTPPPDGADRRSRRSRSGQHCDRACIFFIFAASRSAGALGVVLARNPVHSALFLVVTLVSVAVFFLQQHAQLLAAVQIIVYAGAIVVLFLFVIMLLGVDREESLRDPIPFQRPAAIALGVIVLGEVLFLAGHEWATGKPADSLHNIKGGATELGGNVERVARVAVHRLPLAVRDHRGTARDRGRRRCGAGPPQRATADRRAMARGATRAEPIDAASQSRPHDDHARPTTWCSRPRSSRSARSACWCGATCS